MGAWMPDPVPVFDIGDIQDGTNMMVTSNMFGDALAKSLGKGSIGADARDTGKPWRDLTFKQLPCARTTP